MLGVLLESRSRRQRRSGGVALSVVAHVALIGLATAATTHSPARPHEPVEPVVVFFPPPAPKPQSPTMRAAPAAHIATTSLGVLPNPMPRFVMPTSTPTSLPEIKAAAGMSLDSLLMGAAPLGTNGGKPGAGLLDVDERSGKGEWRGAELLMRIVSSARPRYPETLRQAGIGGRVLVRFTVDTTGRIDPASVRIVESTHDTFSRAVRESLSAFRFKPAEVGGRRVPALAEMPFEFAITR